MRKWSSPLVSETESIRTIGGGGDTVEFCSTCSATARPASPEMRWHVMASPMPNAETCDLLPVLSAPIS